MSIARNFIYNLVYQILVIIFPIVTIPYVTRVLGSTELGIFAFTDTIIQYFVLAGSLGMGIYASRHIAYARDNVETRTQAFWELFSIKTITVLLALIVFYLFFGLTNLPYKDMYFIQSINIVAILFDVSWFFVGLEDFKKILMRNLIVRLLGYAGLFIFIKDKNDLALYVFLIAITNFIGTFSLLFYIPKYVSKFKWKYFYDSFKHFMPCLILFIPQIAIQIYTILDKTMLGVFSSPSEVAYYDMSQKLVRIALSLLTSISFVLMPRISNCFSKGDISQIKEFSIKSFKFSMYLALPIMLGLIGISDSLVSWFLGQEFSKVGILLNFTAYALPLAAAGSICGNQLLIPAKKEREYTLSLLVGAGLNFVLNIFLIPKINSVGACIASLLSQLVITCLQFYAVRFYLPLKASFSEMWKYLLSSALMFISIKITGHYISSAIVATFVEIMVGMTVYVGSQHVLNSKIQALLIEKALQVINFDRLKEKILKV